MLGMPPIPSERPLPGPRRLARAERRAWVLAAAARATVLVDGEPAVLLFASHRRAKVRRFTRHEWVAIERVELVPQPSEPAGHARNLPNRG